LLIIFLFVSYFIYLFFIILPSFFNRFFILYLCIAILSLLTILLILISLVLIIVLISDNDFTIAELFYLGMWFFVNLVKKWPFLILLFFVISSF
jgi:hypothetical protein